MDTVLAILGGSSTLGALALVAYLVVKLVKGKDAQLADRDAREASDRRADSLQQERDGLQVRLAASGQTNADLMLAKAQLESERNGLAAQVAKLEAEKLAALPVGDEGAKVVNDAFGTPLLSESGADALEKP